VNPVAAAYKWAYEYLQSRMESLGRDGWAHDCDSEIEARIVDAQDPLRKAVEQFLASYKDGNVHDMLDYYEEIFRNALEGK
jgi:hypothetical protein